MMDPPVPSPIYSWERAGVRVIRNVENRSMNQITLTLTLSHEYVEEGTRGVAMMFSAKAHCDSI